MLFVLFASKLPPWYSMDRLSLSLYRSISLPAMPDLALINISAKQFKWTYGRAVFILHIQLFPHSHALLRLLLPASNEQQQIVIFIPCVLSHFHFRFVVRWKYAAGVRTRRSCRAASQPTIVRNFSPIWTSIVVWNAIEALRRYWPMAITPLTIMAMVSIHMRPIYRIRTARRHRCIPLARTRWG